MEVSLLPLDRALRLNPDASGQLPCAAFVGAGGKTTALFQLARLLLKRANGVLVTTTTHLGLEQSSLADNSIQIQSDADLLAALRGLEPHKIHLITGPPDLANQHLTGLAEPLMSQLWEAAQERHLPLLVEADGARRKPLKAPAAYEPVIPDFANLVVVCAGLSGLGQALNETLVHRSEIFARLTSLNLGDPITSQALACLLNHPQGGLKAIPPGARRVLLLNQADTSELEAQARTITEKAMGNYESVLTGVLARGGVLSVHEHTAGIILAAGGGRRFGLPKQLLEFNGQPLVRHTAQLALSAGLDPVVVVCGAYHDQVRNALKGISVICVENPDWELGQSTSLIAGIRKLPPSCGSVVFLLADQPFLSLGVILALLEAHSRSQSPIVAPRVGDRRANPVLFDRVTFPELLRLEGDTGGRALIQSGRYRVEWLEWLDQALLDDIDTPEDYARLTGRLPGDN